MIDRRTILDLWEQRANPAAAKALLAASNEYFKAGQPLPPLLAHWHSKPIEQALSASTGRNGEAIEHQLVKAYTRGLGIARSDNRPMAFVSKLWLLLAIQRLGNAYCEKDLRRQVEAEFNVSANTARARIRDAKRVHDEGRERLQSLFAQFGLARRCGEAD